MTPPQLDWRCWRFKAPATTTVNLKYARQLNHALQWLIENQQEDGCLYVPADVKSNESSRMYSHGIAALALTEAYGMTQDLQIRDAAEKALDYIGKSQDPRKAAGDIRPTREKVNGHVCDGLDDDGDAKWAIGWAGNSVQVRLIW